MEKTWSKNKIIVFLLLVAGIIIVTLIGMYGGSRYSKLYRMERIYGGANKSVVLKNIRIAENTDRPHPFISVGTFHGKLSKTGTVKIVFGIAGKNPSYFDETLGNAYYAIRYMRTKHIKFKVAIVVYGAMVVQLKPGGQLEPLVMKMHKAGVKFYACYNAMLINRIIRASLPAYITPVPMGILKIYELEKRGYLYFTNP